MKVSWSRSPWPWLRSACAFCTEVCTAISARTRSLCWSAVALALSDSMRFSCAPFSWMKALASWVASCSRRTATSKLRRDRRLAEPHLADGDAGFQPFGPDPALDLAFDQRPLVDQVEHLGRTVDGDEDRLAFRRSSTGLPVSSTLASVTS